MPTKMAIESQLFFDFQILKVLLLRLRLDRPERRRDDELPYELLPEDDRRDEELGDELLLAARGASAMHDARRIARSQNRRFAQQQICVKTGLKTIKTTPRRAGASTNRHRGSGQRPLLHSNTRDSQKFPRVVGDHHAVFKGAAQSRTAIAADLGVERARQDQSRSWGGASPRSARKASGRGGWSA